MALQKHSTSRSCSSIGSTLHLTDEVIAQLREELAVTNSGGFIPYASGVFEDGTISSGTVTPGSIINVLVPGFGFSVNDQYTIGQPLSATAFSSFYGFTAPSNIILTNAYVRAVVVEINGDDNGGTVSAAVFLTDSPFSNNYSQVGPVINLVPSLPNPPVVGTTIAGRGLLNIPVAAGIGVILVFFMSTPDSAATVVVSGGIQYNFV